MPSTSSDGRRIEGLPPLSTICRLLSVFSDECKGSIPAAVISLIG